MLLGRDPSVDGAEDRLHRRGRLATAWWPAPRDMPNGKRRLLSVVLGTASREARAESRSC